MKGQASMELITMVLAILVIIIAFFLASFSRESSIRDDETQRKLNSVCNDVATKIDRAVFFGNGFTQNVTLPGRIFDLQYSIDVYNRTLLCKAGKFNRIEMFTADRITNTTNYPPFSIPIRQITVNNTQGTIVIS